MVVLLLIAAQSQRLSLSHSSAHGSNFSPSHTYTTHMTLATLTLTRSVARIVRARTATASVRRSPLAPTSDATPLISGPLAKPLCPHHLSHPLPPPASPPLRPRAHCGSRSLSLRRTRHAAWTAGPCSSTPYSLLSCRRLAPRLSRVQSPLSRTSLTPQHRAIHPPPIAYTTHRHGGAAAAAAASAAAPAARC